MALLVTYRRRQKMCVLDAAQEAASVNGFSERTVRRYWKEWSRNVNEGSFDDCNQEKHQRHTLLSEDEECRSRALAWVRTNAIREGQGNLTARAFASSVNDKLLPNVYRLAGSGHKSTFVEEPRRRSYGSGFHR